MRTLATGLTLSLLASLAASCPSGATPERRIAIGPGPVYSHYVQFTAIAEELASRGNSVMVSPPHRELTNHTSIKRLWPTVLFPVAYIEYRR